MGKFRHLLSSIRRGRVLVSFVICCRRSMGWGRGGNGGGDMSKFRHLLSSI